jgi:hypothetical protein
MNRLTALTRWPPRKGKVGAWCWRLGWLAALLGQTAGLVGCHPPPRAPEVQAVRLDDISGWVEFMAQQRKQNQTSKTGTGDIHSRETILQEDAELDTRGYIYHPNLLDFSVGGLFGLLQHRYSEDTSDSRLHGSDSGTVLGYHFEGDVFKQKPYPGSVFLRREEGLEPRMFASSVRTTTENDGVLWQYVSPKTPTRLQYTYNDVHYNPFDPQAEFGERQNSTLKFDTAYRFTEHNYLKFQFEYQQVKEDSQAKKSENAPQFHLAYDSTEFTLGHFLEFGDQFQHRLESELEHLKQSGSLDEDRWRWRETLRLKHTDTLRSWYDFEYLDQTRGSLANLAPIEEHSYRFSGTLEHQLYESLVSQLTGYGQKQNFMSGADMDRLGADLRLAYTKRNALGVLRADYDARIEEENRHGRQLRAEVLDERQTFRDPDPVRLSNSNVDTGSIVITATDNITYYRQDRDYRVRTVGDRSEIERIPTGRIADGDTVLIDYTYQLGGTFELDTRMQNFSIRQDFKFGFSPYYRFRWQDQTITPATASGAVPEDITAHIIGGEFRWATLFLGAEYEDHFSSINSYDATRLNAGYSYHFKWDGIGSLRATWSDMDYAPPRNRQTRLTTLEARYRQNFKNNFSAEGAAVFRRGRDTETGPQKGVDLSLAVEWRFRKIELRFTGEHKTFDDNFARNDSSMLFFQIRRNF